MQTFSKSERLSGKVLIDKLIESGASFNISPFRGTWRIVDVSESNVQVLISVPKRIYKRAVDRNLLKRRIRESYRKNKTELCSSMENKNMHFMLIYTSKSMLEYKELEEKTKEVLIRLVKEVKSKN